jgi:pimeloyl-ACP methyl ester carboxylesterase
MFNQGLAAILDRRDLILFDQRGTGYSRPRLDCPERDALTPVLLSGELPDDQEGPAIVEAFRRCHERLGGEGIDLSAYQSAASAADVNDLGRALGYGPLNLYAVSYGTRLALTVLRDHPEAVRSAVLDSAYPLEVNLYTALAPNAERAFHVLFERCTADPQCSAAYPDLQTVFYSLVDQLNADPVEVTLTAGGAERRVSLDGDLLIDVLFVGLYNPAVTARMPRMISDIRAGDYRILRDRLGLYFDTSGALGMQMAVQCAEEIPFSQPEEAFTAAEGVQGQIAKFFPASVQPLFAACRDWSSAQPEPGENLPVSGAGPALVLAGEYDPITPPDWGRAVAANLARASFFEFPGNGHWVTRSSGCALGLALAFWDDPATAPDASCLQSVGGLDFD